jgi:energy-coupling factor transport system ATP-binding protein
MIEVSDLRFRYSPDSPDVLNGISVTIAQGSFTVIMGSNGSGKSTLARCLNGLLVPTAGVVKVDGVKTDDAVDRQKIRRKVGLVFQDPNLQMTSLTVEREIAFGLENIGMMHDEMHARVDEYIQMFGFENRRGDPPSSLSAGERQRLAIASVMILQPSYLVLDEATSLLAARSRSSILEMVFALRSQQNIGIILITQYPSEAQLGERLVVMHQGRIVFDDLPDRVFRHGDALLRMGVAIPVNERLRVAV